MYNCKKSCRSFFCIFIGLLLFLELSGQETSKKKDFKNPFNTFLTKEAKLTFMPMISPVFVIVHRDSNGFFPDFIRDKQIIDGFLLGGRVDWYEYTAALTFGFEAYALRTAINIDERNRKRTSVSFNPYFKLKGPGTDFRLMLKTGLDFNLMLNSNYESLLTGTNVVNIDEMRPFNYGFQTGLGFTIGSDAKNRKVRSSELLFVFHYWLNDIFMGETVRFSEPTKIWYMSIDWHYRFDKD